MKRNHQIAKKELAYNFRAKKAKKKIKNHTARYITQESTTFDGRQMTVGHLTVGHLTVWTFDGRTFDGRTFDGRDI